MQKKKCVNYVFHYINLHFYAIVTLDIPSNSEKEF